MSNRLPIYIIFILIGVAIVFRIANPPAPPIPGPIGGFPVWKSITQLGTMASKAVNPAGSMWAGAWNLKPKKGTERSAVWTIDFEGYAAKPCSLPNGADVGFVSWVDDSTVGVVKLRSGDNVVYIDAKTGKIKEKGSLHETSAIDRVLCWPSGSKMLLTVLKGNDKPVRLAVFDDMKGMAGKEVAFELPKDGAIESGGGIAADGSIFVFSVSDPAAVDGRSFYLADTKTGIAKKVFDLGAVPGRIEGIWPSAAGVLMVCKVKDKLESVVYDPATGKLNVLAGGVGDLAKWPGAPKSMGFTTYNGGYLFDLASAKTKTVFDLTKKKSDQDHQWRDMIRDSRLYPLKNGNSVIISESGGAVDIRELKKNGEWERDLLKRF